VLPAFLVKRDRTLCGATLTTVPVHTSRDCEPRVVEAALHLLSVRPSQASGELLALALLSFVVVHSSSPIASMSDCRLEMIVVQSVVVQVFHRVLFDRLLIHFFAFLLLPNSCRPWLSLPVARRPFQALCWARVRAPFANGEASISAPAA
jgi:hypothetical protein